MPLLCDVAQRIEQPYCVVIPLIWLSCSLKEMVVGLTRVVMIKMPFKPEIMTEA